MASTLDFVEFVVEQIQEIGVTKHKKMFGEYMVYVNDKPILLVCDNTVYVKIVPEIEGKIEEKGYPYNGAKEHYILDIDNREFSQEIVSILEKVIPIPKPKKKKVA